MCLLTSSELSLRYLIRAYLTNQLRIDSLTPQLTNRSHVFNMDRYSMVFGRLKSAHYETLARHWELLKDQIILLSNVSSRNRSAISFKAATAPFSIASSSLNSFTRHRQSCLNAALSLVRVFTSASRQLLSFQSAGRGSYPDGLPWSCNPMLSPP
jgi:hypothetical protein